MNKKGKLFGLFNIFDLFVVVLVIAVFFGAYKIFTKTKIGPITPNEKVLVTFQCDQAPDFAINPIKEGDLVADESRNIKFGKVIGTPIIGENLRPEFDKNGKYVVADMPGYKSIEITTEAMGKYTDYGLSIDTQLYGKGHSMVLRVGQSKLYVKVKDIVKP